MRRTRASGNRSCSSFAKIKTVLDERQVLLSYTLSKERLGKYACSRAEIQQCARSRAVFRWLSIWPEQDLRVRSRPYKARICTQRSQEGQSLLQLHPWDLPE